MGLSDFSLIQPESDSGCLPLSPCLGNKDLEPNRDLDLTDRDFAASLLISHAPAVLFASVSLACEFSFHAEEC